MPTARSVAAAVSPPIPAPTTATFTTRLALGWHSDRRRFDRRAFDLQEFVETNHAQQVFFERRPIAAGLSVRAKAVGEVGIDLLPRCEACQQGGACISDDSDPEAGEHLERQTAARQPAARGQVHQWTTQALADRTQRFGRVAVWHISVRLRLASSATFW